MKKVENLIKSVNVVEAISQAENGLRKSDIAERLGGYSSPEVYEIVDKVSEGGFVEERGSRYLIDLTPREKPAELLEFLIEGYLARFKVLPPKDLADVIKRRISPDISTSEVYRAAGRLAEKGIIEKTKAWNRYGNGKTYSRDFYLLPGYRNELKEFNKIYADPKRREEHREEIFESGGEEKDDGKSEEDEEFKFRELAEAPELIEHIKNRKSYQNQIIHEEVVPASEAKFGDLDFNQAKIRGYLKKTGLNPLYTHQAEAVELVREGKNTVVATPNASGKSLCYIIPAAEKLSEKGNTVLYLSPTKALARDQLERFRKLDRELGLNANPSTYDGDTPREKRKSIRNSSRVILTNPDMLHYGILPYHEKLWSDFFSNLSLVIMDEMHLYNGVFGAQVSNVLRRLNRVAEYHGGEVQYVCASATIANPVEGAEKLTDKKFVLVDENGAPSQEKHFIVWNPPRGEDGIRRSAFSQAIPLLEENLEHMVSHIAFGKTRNRIELLKKRINERLPKGASRMLKSYRAGYKPNDRRKIERQINEDEILGLVSTNALEVGIDIEGLDSSILVGWPGSIASMWQQANRAGRRDERSLVILILENNTLNQFYASNPEILFEEPPENMSVNPENPQILDMHAACAVTEVPVPEDGFFANAECIKKAGKAEKTDSLFCPECGNFLSVLENRKRYCGSCNDIVKDSEGEYFSDRKWPQGDIDIRGSLCNQQFAVQTSDGRQLGELERDRVCREYPSGAVYLHQGNTYMVSDIDFRKKVVQVQKMPSLSYYTETVTPVNITRLDKLDMDSWGEIKAQLCNVEIEQSTDFLVKIDVEENRVVGKNEVNMPSIKYQTVGFFLELPSGLKERVGLSSAGEFERGVRAVEHLLSSLVPVNVLCGPGDLEGTCFFAEENRSVVISIFDAIRGGAGISEQAFRDIPDLVSRAKETLANCPCRNGCPSCIHKPGRRNENLSKSAAMEILEKMAKCLAPDSTQMEDKEGVSRIFERTEVTSEKIPAA